MNAEAAFMRPNTTGSDDEPESDVETITAGRTSFEVTQDDHEVLQEDEEREKLLMGDADQEGLRRIFVGNNGKEDARAGHRRGMKQKKSGKSDRKRRRRRRDSASVYAMEEGGQSSSSLSSTSSSESDQQRLGNFQAKRLRPYNRVLLHISILSLFLVLLYAAYRASSKPAWKEGTALFNNGTSRFAATTILVSLDGFRADFLQRGITPTLNSFIQNGISPPWMLPSFPSVTFPNHYTMVTGLYPESHGIVGNTFWDPAMQEEFSRSMQAKWWGGEPLWITAENQGVRTAVHMWPGSEAHIGDIEPAHLDKYNGSEPLSSKVDRIMQLLDLPGPESPSALADQPRPQLILTYVPVVDTDGHNYGPNSTEIRRTIQQVDTMVGDIFEGLQQRNLTETVNVVVVSDHGMATTSVDRLIQLEDLVDVNRVEHIDGWPLFGLRPKDPNDLQPLYEELQSKAKDNPNIDVYLRDVDMPARYHFSNNDRIAPLWIVPKAGWAIATKEEFDLEAGLRNGEVYHPRGLHGYDHEHPLMRAIFVARGPAFPHKPGSRVDVFQNTEIYNIVCDSVGLTPKANNGTLRLPLKPVGLHSDEDAPVLDVPSDPPETTISDAVSPSSATFSLAPPAIEASATEPVPIRPTVDHNDEKEPTPTNNQDEDRDWWQWVKDKFDGAKAWAEDHFGNNSNRTSA
ncbi:hypothetical protein W97_01114 [Coniosporium apollinis CBS 100218]|uniref:Ectonucleotide pyrophosphatase/phosphodiesterase family member 1/3 n=1 Tax=Coniosporium apollinis (strain CBS 100218) TaxID=1168221 RepID=R7YJR2_CONA1|nr:uncharacterized protein W97_01114 [Coniosporium apollinis CBS 100218]EON61896.1 hypothetical protein W97_01114 [Coniosporium apollinis CBS 100218]